MPAHLPPYRGLRALRAQREGVHLGAHDEARQGQVGARPGVTAADGTIARVLPDVPAIAKLFDYRIPPDLGPRISVGTMVRVPLQGRRVGGWVVELPAMAETDRPLAPVAKITGHGPAPELIELARWAAWRWAGRVPTFLRTASPPFAVRHLPAPPSGSAESSHSTFGERSPGAAGEWSEPSEPPDLSELTRLARAALATSPSVLRVPPADDITAVVTAVLSQMAPRGSGGRSGSVLVLAPSLSAATSAATALRQTGRPVALMPRDWARAAAGGCVVVGTRAGAWAPAPDLAGVVVIDEHDEVYSEERAPTWNARDVAVERARRAGVAAVLTSPCPSLESLASAHLLVLSRSGERAGWPVVEVIDRRKEPPGLGLYSERLVSLLRSEERVLCVLNRKGRAQLLACAACDLLARCDRCGAAVASVRGTDDTPTLRCRRCTQVRPVVCLGCGGGRMRVLRPGVTRAREELEALARRPVAEVTGDGPAEVETRTSVAVGTEAVLHRFGPADVVAFLDFDQELLAPRYRAGEQALGLLARAARLVGGRAGGGRLVVQTRLPDHEVLDAALHADPARLAVVESAGRVALRLPPEAALAVVSGPAAPALIAALPGGSGVEVLGPAGNQWLLRAADHSTLCDALARTRRPPGRVRVSVDPLRA